LGASGVQIAPIRRTSLAAEIAALLRRQILAGELGAGARLPAERALAAQLGTNRNTLREAIRMLEAQGLVRVRHGDGVTVQDHRVHGTLELVAPFLLEAAEPAERLQVLLDALGVRRLLGAEAAAAAAGNSGPESGRAITAALDAVLAETEQAARAQRDLALFATLIDASGRLLYRWALNGILRACRGVIAQAPELWWLPDDYEPSWREIAEAIAGGDAPRARSLVEAYFARTDEALAAVLPDPALLGGGAP
jgi:DNA-binding FadR family transcriptional regulator